MEFMLETICDIKNNKKKPKDDPANHTRIKKWLHKVFLFYFIALLLCRLPYFFSVELNLLNTCSF